MRTPALVLVAFLSLASPALAVPPVPSYSVTPDPPVAGSQATFTDASTDADGDPITLIEWDFQNDGAWDATQNPATDPPATHTYPSAGTWSLRMRVTAGGETAEIVDLISVAAPNVAPNAQFGFSPQNPVVGEQVRFESFSKDPDGSIADDDLEWDLGDDGTVEGTGQTFSTSFLTEGPQTVTLRVTDDDGAEAIVSRSFTVGPVPAPPDPVIVTQVVPGPTTVVTAPAAPTTTPAEPSLMSPFPIVRIAGTVLRRGVRVRTLEVRTSLGSRITVRCVGRGCPFARASRVAEQRLVRFRGIRGFLRAGVAVSISVRKTGQIGKYTRFVIRANRVPKRTDLCLLPGRSSPSECPES